MADWLPKLRYFRPDSPFHQSSEWNILPGTTIFLWTASITSLKASVELFTGSACAIINFAGWTATTGNANERSRQIPPAPDSWSSCVPNTGNAHIINLKRIYVATFGKIGIERSPRGTSPNGIPVPIWILWAMLCLLTPKGRAAPDWIPVSTGTLLPRIPDILQARIPVHQLHGNGW